MFCVSWLSFRIQFLWLLVRNFRFLLRWLLEHYQFLNWLIQHWPSCGLDSHGSDLAIVISICNKDSSHGPLASETVSFNRTISPSARFLFCHARLCLSYGPLQVLFTPPISKFISNMLYTPSASPAVNIFSLELSWRRMYLLATYTWNLKDSLLMNPSTTLLSV